MKYLNVLLLAIIILSCCSTKKAPESEPKQIVQVETARTPKPITPSEVVVEVPEQLNEEQEVITQKSKQTKGPETIVASNEIFDHTTWNALLQKHVSDQGNVNYKALKIDRKILTNYIRSLAENTPKETWTKEDKLAYWINAYNALTVDLILRNYPIKSIKDIDDRWELRLWKLGEKWYNLEDIEHEILRKMNEPRIHFAIVCASFSCPKLLNKAYTASNLDAQLTQATKDFLSDSKRNSISKDHLELSKIFQWFSKDFKQNGSLIDFLNQYSDIEISQNAKKRYKDCNWDLNE
jgi:hypothetical protein